MTGLIAIDESGDLGSSGSRYFCIAAIIMLRTRDLKKASSLLAKDCEGKWYNTFPEKRIRIMEAMAESNMKVVYTVVDKNHPGGAVKGGCQRINDRAAFLHQIPCGSHLLFCIHHDCQEIVKHVSNRIST